MMSLLWLVDTALSTVSFVVIISAVLSWLIAFNIVNRHHRIVWMIAGTLEQLTEPLLRPIRRFLPVMGGLDLSPVILLIAIMFLRRLLVEYWPI
ncbi:MAG: YggT family protein [Pseudomonadota bacterium]